MKLEYERRVSEVQEISSNMMDYCMRILKQRCATITLTVDIFTMVALDSFR